MNIAQQRMSMIFDEWAKRFEEDPTKFDTILDDDGKVVTEYGERCTRCFEQIADDMKDVLPKLVVIDVSES